MAEGRSGSRWTKDTQDALCKTFEGYCFARFGKMHNASLEIIGKVLDEYGLAVFPVGEPDDERLVKQVAEALRLAFPNSGTIQGTRRRLAEAAVAAVRAAGEENPE